MHWLIPPQPQAFLPIVGDTRRFPVRRLICVAQNYDAHAREMGASQAEPFFFLKPADTLVVGKNPLSPPGAADLHYEVELVAAVGDGGALIGWAVGCDLTRRALQAIAKQKGRPWDAAKGFDQSAPCSALTLGAEPGPDTTISLSLNGEVRQTGVLGQMVWNPSRIVAEAQAYWDVGPGDLIFTGTPEGVGPVQPGDQVVCQIGDLETLAFRLEPR
jgi:2-keto-4-pentenoate hydratase/2-oxohepta-3-ene-1,7-dioic acid hydratase (catechol pathway)